MPEWMAAGEQCRPRNQCRTDGLPPGVEPVSAAQSVSRYISAFAAAHPDQLAVTCGARTATWRELESATNRLARAFLAAGAAPGSMVSIGHRNGIPFIESCIAAWKIGGIPQPLPTSSPPRELESLLALVNPSLVVGLPVDLDLPYNQLAGSADLTGLDDSQLPDAVAPAWRAIPSGGSTGLPKIVVSASPSSIGGPGSDLTIVAKRAIGVEPGKRMVFPAPLYHSGSFGQALPSLLSGAHLILMERFDPEGVLATIERHRAQWVFLVPTMMARILKLDRAVRESYDLSSLESLWHAAAPIAPWLKQAWIDWLGPERVYESYGASDAAGYTVIRGDEWLTHRGSVGRTVIGEVCIADTEGHVMGPGVVGEIFMRPPENAFRRVYIGARPQRQLADSDWSSVGDLGYLDDEGYLYVVDRRVDLIITGGVNVYPAEVEGALDEHPSVVTSAVVGVPDHDLGRRVHALVQVAPGHEVFAGELKQFLAVRLAGAKIPRSWEFTTSQIRDEAGKVRRSAIAADAARRLRAEPGPATGS
jgi:bile acid-coenzyme A ligase